MTKLAADRLREDIDDRPVDRGEEEARVERCDEEPELRSRELALRVVLRLSIAQQRRPLVLRFPRRLR